MTENEFPLEEVLRVHSEFVELYRTTGLVAISDNYIHVNPKTLAALADPEIWYFEVVRSSDFDTPYHARMEIHGITFVAVLDAAEMAEYGLEVPGA